MIKLLFYVYAIGERSERKIASKCETDTAYMYLSQMYQTDFRTINDFRKNNLVDNLSPIFLINNYIHTTEGLGLLMQRNIWISAAVYPHENGGRNDIGLFVCKLFKPSSGMPLKCTESDFFKF
jgi:hypothetical protein